jgi:hypothetical protein
MSDLGGIGFGAPASAGDAALIEENCGVGKAAQAAAPVVSPPGWACQIF